MLGTRVILNSGKGVGVAVDSGTLVAVAIGTRVSVGVAVLGTVGVSVGLGVGGTGLGVASGFGVQNGRCPQAAATAPTAVATVNFKKSLRDTRDFIGSVFSLSDPLPGILANASRKSTIISS